MAMQGVLFIESVKGECKIEGYSTWIDVKNFTWEISQKTSYQSGGGMAGGGRPEIQPFHFEKDADTTSAEIVKKCLSGTHFPKAELRLLKPGGVGSTPYLEFVKFVFTRVFITKVGITGSNDADAPGEAIDFVAEEVEYDYAEQKPDGGLEAYKKAGWNVKKNKATV